MAESPYGLAYGLGAATSNLMGSYMQGQQYGLQRQAQQQQMDLAKRHADMQQQLGQAQIEHMGLQNKAIDEETRQKVREFSQRMAGESIHIGEWGNASEALKALGYHVDPSTMSFVKADGTPTKIRTEAIGAMGTDVDGNPLFLDNNSINEWRFGGKFAQATTVADKNLQGRQYGADKGLEGKQYAADKRLEGIEQTNEMRIKVAKIMAARATAAAGLPPAKSREVEILAGQIAKERDIPVTQATMEAVKIVYARAGISPEAQMKAKLAATKAMVQAFKDPLTGKPLKGLEDEAWTAMNDLAEAGGLGTTGLGVTGGGNGGYGGGGRPAAGPPKQNYEGEVSPSGKYVFRGGKWVPTGK